MTNRLTDRQIEVLGVALRSGYLTLEAHDAVKAALDEVTFNRKALEQATKLARIAAYPLSEESGGYTQLRAEGGYGFDNNNPELAEFLRTRDAGPGDTPTKDKVNE